jgi:hypothetical protein
MFIRNQKNYQIDRLMALCDRLEESIEAAKGKQTDLLNALMSQVLGICVASKPPANKLRATRIKST